jgi:hypothetical protein
MGFGLSSKQKNELRLKLCVASFFLFLAVGTGSGSEPAVSQSNGLPAPWQQKAVSVTLFPDHTIPKIDHGYTVVSRRMIIDGIQQEAIYLKSLADGTERQTSFWISGASVIWINDLAAASSDKLFVVGSFRRSADGVPINFVAEADMSGHTLRTIDMGSYEPELACVAPDGSFWTFGQDWSAERSDIPYSLLRNYSSTGRLLGSYLPSDTLPPARLNFSTRVHRMGGARGRMFLQCGQQSVGAYIGPVGTWVEIDFADKTSQVWQVNPPSAGMMTGLALLKRHEVYCSFRGQNTVFVRGFFKLNLSQPKIATWEPIAGMVQYLNVAQKSPPAMSVIGADGPSLVYQSIDSGRHIFFWIRP